MILPEWAAKTKELETQLIDLGKEYFTVAKEGVEGEGIATAFESFFRSDELLADRVDEGINEYWKKMKEKNISEAPFQETKKTLESIYDIAECYADLIVKSLKQITTAIIKHVPEIATFSGDCLSAIALTAESIIDTLPDISSSFVEPGIAIIGENLPGIGVALASVALAQGAVSVAQATGNKIQ